MKNTFYSNGKLFISGEYLVLEGALAFALPTKFGQSMQIETNDSNVINWTCYDADNSIWMNESVPVEVITTNSPIEGTGFYNTLVEVLRAAHVLNPTVLNENCGYNAVCKLSFPRLWGLGTSSTWVANVAQWFNINAYELLANSFGGSGYDIACALADKAVFYTRTDIKNPTVEQFVFNPVFKQQLYFVYLNQKKNSKEAIAHFKAKRNQLSAEVETISSIGHQMRTCTDLQLFQDLIEQHETIISKVIEEQPIKQKLFADFDGAIKSLGAWGGDFVLVASKNNPTTYFKGKGYEVIVDYDTMIL